MTFTYSGDPSTNQRNAVRFLINDTNPNDPLFSDEEINYLVYEWGTNVYEICRAACETLSSKFTRLADSTSKNVGDISVSESYSSKASQYRELADSFLKRRLRKAPAGPWANSEALKSTTDRLVDNYHTDFHLGQMDNPNSQYNNQTNFQ